MDREESKQMTEQEVRELVAEVICLRGAYQWREDDDQLIQTGAALNSQVGGADIKERSAQLREMSPGQLLLQTDLETGSHLVADGTEVPPLMAIGAADDEQLAHDWGYAVGLEGRRLGVDVTWSPVLDVNTNPDNPIINVRSFGEHAEQVGRLGAAMTRGFIKSGIQPCAKHWPGHGDVAVDSHISLPTVDATRERLESIDWLPYRMARGGSGERHDRPPARALSRSRQLRHRQPHHHHRDTARADGLRRRHLHRLAGDGGAPPDNRLRGGRLDGAGGRTRPGAHRL
jgi:beta-glucosidase-like glycosyl hydrolase